MKNEEDAKEAFCNVQTIDEFSGLHLNKQKSGDIWVRARKWDRGGVNDIPRKGTIKILGIF